MKHLIRTVRWLPALFILCCSWYLSSQPTIRYMPGFWNADKVVHCICFAGFAFWIAFGIGPRIVPTRTADSNNTASGNRLARLDAKLRILTPIAAIAVYAVIDELHQSRIPGRSCSPFDWLADVTGATIGSVTFFFVCKWMQTRRKPSSSDVAID